MRLKTFGALALVSERGAVEEAKIQRRPLAVLAVLAASVPQGVTRERLIALFWPDKAPELASRSLTMALLDASRALGQNVVLKSDPTLHLNPDVLPSDVGAFVRAQARADDEAMIAAYAGPFLDAVYITNTPEFEQWVEAKRTTFRDAYVGALLRASAASRERGDLPRAVEHVRKAAREDKLSAEVTCALMRLLVESRNKDGARAAARIYTDLVRDQLGADPDPSVARLLAEIEQGRHDPPVEVPSPAPVEKPFVPAEAPSVAALSFDGYSEDPRDAVLAEGMTEELTTRLTRLAQLRVVPRTTVISLSNLGLDAIELGRRLGVDSVVEGSVRCSGPNVRVSAALIRVEDGAKLFLARFDRPRGDVFAVQEEITSAIAEQLTKIVPPPAPRSKPGQEAYERYHLGRFFRDKRSPKSLLAAIQSFREAQALEPGYAEAYAGEAGALAVLAAFDVVPAHETNRRMRESAQCALDLDPSLSEPHAVLGAAAALHDWDWAAADHEFELAIALNEQDQIAHTWRANYFLAPLGRLDEALAANARALRLDKMSPIINASTGMLLTFAGRYEEAAKRFRDVLDLDPKFLYASYFLGRAELELGHYSAAIEALERTVALSDGNGVPLAALAHAHARAGDLDEARALLSRLESLRSTQCVSSFQFALVHAALGETDAALTALERAAEERSPFLAWLGVQPGLDGLRKEARFQALLTRIGIAAAH